MDQKHNTLSQKIYNELKPIPNLNLLSFAIKKGRGSRLYDYDGNKYFDFDLHYGATILGYQYKNFSLQLKNTVNSGLYGYYPNHLILRAKKETLLFAKNKNPRIDEKWEVVFFSSYSKLREFQKHHNFETMNIPTTYFNRKIPLELLNVFSQPIMEKEHTIYYCGNILSSIESLPNYCNAFIVGTILGNGTPIISLFYNTAVFKNIHWQDSALTSLHFKALLVTLKALTNINFENYFNTLLKPYKQEITYYGNGAFSINNLHLHSMEKLYEKLIKKCIIVNRTDNIFFISLQSTKDEIAYFFNTLKKVGALDDAMEEN